MNRPLVTLSLVTYNNEEMLPLCLDSIQKQTYNKYELFILDNSSTDQTIKLIRRYKYKNLKHTFLTYNSGFCKGHNINLSMMNGKYVLLVNPDIILEPHYLENAVDCLELRQDIGALAGLLFQNSFDQNDAIIDSGGLELKENRTCHLIFHGEYFKDLNIKSSIVFGVDGALPFYRKSLVDDLSVNGQFFDELFFMHKEDWDVSWRAFNRGWITIFYPNCRAIHPRHFKPGDLKIRKSINPNIRYHTVKNQIILLLKNESKSGFKKYGYKIIFRQILILGYNILFDWGSMHAYFFIIKNLRLILDKRKQYNHFTQKLFSAII